MKIPFLSRSMALGQGVQLEKLRRVLCRIELEKNWKR